MSSHPYHDSLNPTLRATAQINDLAELIGMANALDRIVGRLAFIAPEALETAAIAELAQIGDR